MDLILLFGGAVVSVLVQLIKERMGTNRNGTLLAVVLLSLLAGAAMWYLKMAGLWESFLQIIISAGAVYAFIIKNLEDASEKGV